MSASEESLRVIVRVKPLLDETAAGNEYSNALTVDAENSHITVSRTRKGISEFSFFGIVGPHEGQAALYDHCSDIVSDVISGVNCSIIAYGQTGSGKTFSMLGKAWTDLSSGSNVPGASSAATRTASPSLSDDDIRDDELQWQQEAGVTKISCNIPNNKRAALDEGVGIIPRCLFDIYETLNDRAARGSIEFSIHVQVMQIYNEKIYDLLQDRRRENPLTLRENNPKLTKLSGSVNLSNSGSFVQSIPPIVGSVYVQGLSEYRVDSTDEVLQLLKRAMRNRAVRSTEFNLESSRSHTILQLSIEVRDKGLLEDGGMQHTPIMLRKSVVRFVDLAGSEKWRSVLSKPGSINADMQKEQTNINTSLHVLGNCVSALTEAGRKHIPFRDSVLTRILQDSLGGGGRTVFIATVSSPMDAVGLDETHSTLQFANRASKIKVTITPHASVVDDGLTLAAARAEIAFLRDKLSALLAVQSETKTHQEESDSDIKYKTSGSIQSSQRSRRRKVDGTLPPSSSSKKVRKIDKNGINGANGDCTPSHGIIEDSCIDDLDNSFFEGSTDADQFVKAEKSDINPSMIALTEQINLLMKQNEELAQRLEEYMTKERELSNHQYGNAALTIVNEGVCDNDFAAISIQDVVEEVSCSSASLDRSLAADHTTFKSIATSQARTQAEVKSPSSDQAAPNSQSLCSVGLADNDIHRIEAAEIDVADDVPRRDRSDFLPLTIDTPPAIVHTPPAIVHTPPKAPIAESSTELPKEHPPDTKASHHLKTNEISRVIDLVAGDYSLHRAVQEIANVVGAADRPKSVPKDQRPTYDNVYMASSTAPAANANESIDILMSSPTGSRLDPSQSQSLGYVRQEGIQGGVVHKADHRLISAVEYGKYVADNIPASPVKQQYSYNGEGGSSNDGICVRHGLAACILCQLGGGGNITNIRSTAPVVDTEVKYSFDEGPGSLASSNGSLRMRNSYIGSHANIINDAHAASVPKGGPCEAHGVSSCVLCVLRGSFNGPLYSVNKASSLNKSNGVTTCYSAQYSQQFSSDLKQPAPTMSPMSSMNSEYGNRNCLLHQMSQYNVNKYVNINNSSARPSYAAYDNAGDSKHKSYNSPPSSNESMVNIGTSEAGELERYAFEASASRQVSEHVDERVKQKGVSVVQDRVTHGKCDDYESSSLPMHQADQKNVKKKRISPAGGLDEREIHNSGNRSHHQTGSILDSVIAGPYASAKDKSEFKRGGKRSSDRYMEESPVDNKGIPLDSIQLPSLAMAAARQALSGSFERYANVPRSNDPGSYETGRASFDHSAMRRNDHNSSDKIKRPDENILRQHKDKSCSQIVDHAPDTEGQGGVARGSWRNITYFDEDDDSASSVKSNQRGLRNYSDTRVDAAMDRGPKKPKLKNKLQNSAAGGIGFGGKKKKMASTGYGAVKAKR